MTSTPTNTPSFTLFPANAEAMGRNPIASLLQALGSPSAPSSTDSNGRADTKTFDMLLVPGVARAPRAVAASGSSAASGQDPQTPNVADAPRVRGSWVSIQSPEGDNEVAETPDDAGVADTGEVSDATEVSSAGDNAEPVRSVLEDVVAMMMSILQTLPVDQPQTTEVTTEPQTDGEVTGVAQGDATDATGTTAGTEISVELPNGESFTVVVPTDAQSALTDVHLKAADKLASREMPEAGANGSEHAAPQSRGARAIEVLTALANGVSPAKSGAPEVPANPAMPVDPTIPADPKVPAPESVTPPDGIEAPATDAAATDAAVAEAAAVETEIELPDGKTIRFTIKPDSGPSPKAHSDVAGLGAEFASSSGNDAGSGNSSDDTLKKTFLSLVKEHVTNTAGGAGIGIARFPANMPEQATLSTPSTFGAQSIAESAAGFDVGTVDSAAGYPESTVDSVARRALEMAINVIEVQAGQRGRNTSTVNLRLRLAGEDIAIRVQLRKGEVRTSFHTESPELQAAISREWQIAASESTQRALRFHEPEFTRTSQAFDDRGAFKQAGGDGHTAREQAESRRETAVHRSFFRSPVAESAKTTVTSPAEAFARGSLHLSTFA